MDRPAVGISIYDFVIYDLRLGNYQKTEPLVFEIRKI